MILGLNLTSIKADIKDVELGGNITVNSAPKVVNITKRDFPDFKDILVVDFEFVVKYDPDVGEILFKGEMLYKDEDSKKALKLWKDEKKMSDEMALNVLNAIVRKCLTKSIDISAELRLPPPIRFPTVVHGEKK
jgi:hypothetical protein